jgi:NADH:ubiquinone oxidoreductase subunit 3 (subunit A)
MTQTLGDKFLAITFGPAIVMFIVFNTMMAVLSTLAGAYDIAGLYALVCALDVVVYKSTGFYRGEKNDLLAIPPKVEA